MDVENRRIVLSIGERLKDYEEEAAEEFVKEHPRLEDVVAAEEAAAAEAEARGETVESTDDADDEYKDVEAD